MDSALLIGLLLFVPCAGGAACATMRGFRRIMAVMSMTVGIWEILAGAVCQRTFARGSFPAVDGTFYIDALSAYHLCVMMMVFAAASIFAVCYFNVEFKAGHIAQHGLRQFAGLWCGALASMTLTLISNNLGIMWVGIEATTLLTAFLICIPRKRASLEAMWKYLMICSVGVAFAFLGTLIIAMSSGGIHLDLSRALLWTELLKKASLLNPKLVKIAFLCLLVGYGTKAGLAPMHSWLPDAHSQAPAPVSAMFSGFMLNAALYCIMRYVPIVEKSSGHSGWSLGLLALFGIISILVAAAFIIFQRDAKRLLAYSSVEHIGIITLAFGLGGWGTFAALFHTLNHSICKSLAFFSTGRLGQTYGSHDMTRMSGSVRGAPVWGTGLFGSLLTLIGVAPFAIFMSEFQVLKAAIDSRWITGAILFLGGSGVVFVGALRHAVALAWGKPSPLEKPEQAGVVEKALAFAPLVILLGLGVWIPGPLLNMLTQAASILRTY